MSSVGVGPVSVNPSTGVTTISKSSNIWRPPQWQSGTPYMITMPAKSGDEAQYYVLTPLRVAHELVLRRTEHPVQSGAAITDHAYVMPTKLMMEIGVSDSMDTYTSGMWGGSSTSTSVNAFDALCELARQRTLVIVQTRLRSYPNMIVESVSAEETSRTVASGRFHVVFSEIFIASTQVAAAATARPDTNASSSKGTVTSMPTLQQIQQMYGVLPNGMVPYTGYVGSITPTPAMNAGVANNGSTAIGAGTASSYSMPTGYQGALSAAGIP